MAKYDVKALREKVFASDDIQYSEVYVDEWGVSLPIKTIAPDDLKRVMKFQDDAIRMSVLAVIYGCKTPDGDSVFTETDLAKFESEKSFGAIMKVAEAIFEISGYSEEAVSEAKND